MNQINGVVILYQPNDNVNENINTYLPFVNKLYVFDNSEPASNKILPNEKIIVIADNQNKGIAERLNQACKLAQADGADWLLTMDQDSYFSEDNLSLYKKVFEQFDDKDKTAIIGVEYNHKPNNKIIDWIDSDALITSGSLVNLKLNNKLGGFDEALFIDDVDGDYCLNTIANGYRSILFNNVYLNHSLGTISVHRSFKNFKKTNRVLHSPIRMYYAVRNYLYLEKKYKHLLPQLPIIRKKTLQNRLKNNLFYGKNKLQLVRFILLAFYHYKKGKMGKLK